MPLDPLRPAMERLHACPDEAMAPAGDCAAAALGTGAAVAIAAALVLVLAAAGVGIWFLLRRRTA